MKRIAACLLLAAAGAASAADDAALRVVEACRARLDARTDIGIERIQKRCPELLPTISAAPWRDLVPRTLRERREELSAESLRALIELVRGATEAGVSGTAPDVAQLAPVLAELGARGQEGATRWERFKRWLKELRKGRKDDEEGLLAVIGTRPKYLGLVASRKKSEALFEYVRTTGTTDEDIAVITCPAGLEIGSETLPEIALSVAAEITRIRRTSAEQPRTVATAIDPICGMTVDVENAKYSSVVDGQTIYFCCLRCKETYDQPQISQLTRI